MKVFQTPTLTASCLDRRTHPVLQLQETTQLEYDWGLNTGIGNDAQEGEPALWDRSPGKAEGVLGLLLENNLLFLPQTILWTHGPKYHGVSSYGNGVKLFTPTPPPQSAVSLGSAL